VVIVRGRGDRPASRHLSLMATAALAGERISSMAKRGRRTRSRVDWTVLACLALGVGLLLAGAATFVHTKRFVAGAEHATGTVVDHSSSSTSEGIVYYPVVRFTTAEGRTVEFSSSSGSSSPPDVGDRVEVRYDPDDPQDAELSGFFDLWGWTIALGGLGILFSAFALFSPGFGLFGQSRLARYLGRLAARAKRG
jgi:hypothetical protein